MVFDAHVRAFDFFGGVPERGIYDNMKTAVQKILRGKERQWNPSFERMCAHYCVEPVACNPASGWEKGRVERQVGVDAQRFFTPIPKVASLDELNEQLLSQVIVHSRTKPHPEFKDQTIESVYQEEKKSLKRIHVPFDASRTKDVKVSTTCLAMFDRNHYSVDSRYAGKIVQCQASVDQLRFIYEGKCVGTHKRLFSRGETVYNWQHYLPILAKKPGALRNGAPFEQMDLPGSLKQVQHYFNDQQWDTRLFAKLLSYIPQTSLEAVEQACQHAIASGTISYEVIVNHLFRSKDTDLEPNYSAPAHLILQLDPVADCSRYDHLLVGLRR